MGVVLDAFRPAPHPPADATAASSEGAAAANTSSAAASRDRLPAFFRQRSTTLQHHALALLGRVLHVDPTAIHAMRAAALWELAYGPAFFFFGQVSRHLLYASSVV